MAQTQRVSRPGGVQLLLVEHDGESYEAEKKQFQREVDGELEDVEEYRLEDDVEDVPDEVVAAVDAVNGDADEDVQEESGDDRPDDAGEELPDQCTYVKDGGERCNLPATDGGHTCHLDAHTAEGE